VRAHTADCAACTAEVEQLRLVLATLAVLPEPEPPAELAIRLDAAIARAWQQADAEQQQAAAAPVSATAPRRGRRPSWARIALPVGALGLLVLAGVGIGYAVNQSGGGSVAGASTGAQNGDNDTALSQWVRSVLPAGAGGASSAAGVGPNVQHGSGPKSSAPNLQGGGPKASTEGLHSPSCPSYPQRAGYTVLTTAVREFDGRSATLVVYVNDTGPADSTVFAVVYAGPCPTASSQVLDQGDVSR
jgi:hypothetical protein